MQNLLAGASRVAPLLIASGASIAVAESSTGGLISAALLSVPGASAYFRGGDVIYTRDARTAFGITAEMMAGMRSASPPYSKVLAAHARMRLGTTWGLAETGASGPSGNSYGDAAGHTCLAVDGPMPMSRVLATGSADRIANMLIFAEAALALLEEALLAAAHHG
jgi:PncC family amidohydrolase